MSFTATPGRASLAGQRFNGFTDAELTAQNNLTFAAINAVKQKAKLDEKQRVQLADLNAQAAQAALLESQDEPTRRQTVRDAVARLDAAQTAYTTAQANVARASERFAAATEQVDRVGDVSERIVQWQAQRITLDQPTFPLPADLAQATEARSLGEARAADLAKVLARLQAQAAAAQDALAIAATAAATAATAVTSCWLTERAQDLLALEQQRDQIRSDLNTALATFLGGRQIPVSPQVHAALNRPEPAAAALDHGLQQRLADYHARLLDDPAATFEPEHNWLRVDDSQIQVIIAGT